MKNFPGRIRNLTSLTRRLLDDLCRQPGVARWLSAGDCISLLENVPNSPAYARPVLLWGETQEVWFAGDRQRLACHPGGTTAATSWARASAPGGLVFPAIRVLVFLICLVRRWTPGRGTFSSAVPASQPPVPATHSLS